MLVDREVVTEDGDTANLVKRLMRCWWEREVDCTWQVCQARLTRLLPCWQLYSVIRSPCARLMWKLILFWKTTQIILFFNLSKD